MISIHALREESDSAKFEVINVPKLFQSTLSARRATQYILMQSDVFKISIHALREESDMYLQIIYQDYLIFQSTLSARRATCWQSVLDKSRKRFQSTLSARRATLLNNYHPSLKSISIHALREESDYIDGDAFIKQMGFQSTLSARRATLGNILSPLTISIFQSTLSARRATSIS